MANKTNLHDEEKSKEQLLQEVRQLRARVQRLEADTTLLHATEDALRTAKEYAETIINSSLDMIIAVDEQRCITEFNPAAEKAFGYRKAEVLGHPVGMLYDQPPQGETIHNKTLTLGRITAEVTNKRKNGDLFDAYLEASVLRDAVGKRVGVMGISRDISEQTRARETQARLTAILEGTLDCVGISIPGGQMVYVNRAGRQLLGLEEEESLTGINVLNFHPEHVRIRLSEIIPTLIETGQWSGETEILSRDGRHIPVSQVVLAHKGPEGLVQFFSTIIRDISAQKTVERALRESEEKYRDLVENISEMIYIVDTSGTVTYISPVVSILGGYAPEEIIGHEFSGFIHPDDASALIESFYRVLAGNFHPSEFRVRKKSGDYFWVRSASRPIIRDGETVGLRGVLMDISENKRAEEALRESEERYRRLFENANDAIATFTLDNVLTSVNRGGERLIGFSRKYLIGQPVQKLASAASNALIEERTRRFLAGDKPPSSTFEIELIHKDGHLIPVEARTRAIRDQQGKLIGFQGVYRDISAKKALERQRADFLAMLAHDIKNPLAAILGYVDLLEQGETQRPTPPESEFIQRIRENAQAILSLVTNYIDIARAEAGNIVLQKTPLSIGLVLRRVVQQYAGIAQRHHVNLLLHAADNLPSLAGDNMALERVFANLVRNALQFTPETGQIVISAVHDQTARKKAHPDASGTASSLTQGNIVVEVSDTGPGIAADDIPFLFHKYRQASSSRSHDGTGLGLFVVKTYVEAHGGHVEVESSLGAGSCFRVVLPLTP
jgi:PAS domain S-box-containing protein